MTKIAIILNRGIVQGNTDAYENEYAVVVREAIVYMSNADT